MSAFPTPAGWLELSPASHTKIRLEADFDNPEDAEKVRQFMAREIFHTEGETMLQTNKTAWVVRQFDFDAMTSVVAVCPTEDAAIALTTHLNGIHGENSHRYIAAPIINWNPDEE